MKYKIQSIERRDFYGRSILVEYWDSLSKRIKESAYLISAELDKFGKKTPLTKMIFEVEVLDLDFLKEVIGEIDTLELVEVKIKGRE